MREYKKPVMQVERFTANTAVAYCTNTYTTTSWEPQTVSCVISSSDNVFGSENCAAKGYEVVDSGSLVYYNGQYYFVWARSNSSGGQSSNTYSTDSWWGSCKKTSGVLMEIGGGSLDGEATLKAILAAGGYDSSNWQNYHAGPVTPTTGTVDKQNWSL